MKVAQLIPSANERLQFNLKMLKFVPKVSGCYVLSTVDDDVLYVGLTDNLYRRFSEHRDNKEKNQQTAQGIAFWFYYIQCEKIEINRIERTWLNIHTEIHGVLPLLNKVYSPVR